MTDEDGFIEECALNYGFTIVDDDDDATIFQCTQEVLYKFIKAIKNFREKKLLKDILELRDQDGLVTFTYIVAEMTGKLVYLGESIGYGIPAATQYSNPQKIAEKSEGYSGNPDNYAVLPQADPNGLFSPSSAEGTWIMLKDPNGSKVRPVYVESRIIVSPFRLN